MTHYLLTYFSLTPCSKVLLEKLIGSQVVKKFPAIYGTRMFITCPYPEPRWSSPCPHIPLPEEPSYYYPHLCMGLPSGLFPSGLPTKMLYTSLLSPYVLHAPPTSFFSIWSPEQYWVRSNRSLSSSLCSFLHTPAVSFLLGPNILLNTLFSNTLSLHSSLNVSNQVSHPYKTTGKTTVLYILIFKFFDSKLEDKRLCIKW